MTAFKALFWKECRENVRWAVLGLLALSLGLVYAAYHELSSPAAASDFSGLRLGYIWDNAGLVFTFGAPLVGLLLGLLQILPEMRRDQWAFLVHRPASRTVLFFGKALPGLGLYLLATALPLLGLGVWDARPGHAPAPFDWHFTLGAWASILSGAAFYFAGLLTALRPARWYGSRPLPILAALTCSLAVNFLNDFWQVVLVCLPAITVLMAAASGSFLTSGQYNGQPRWARFALGTTLYVGLAVAVIGATIACFGLYQSVFPPARAYVSYTQYNVDTQGRIFRLTWTAAGQETFTDLDGRALKHSDITAQRLNFTSLDSWMSNQAEQNRYNQPSRYVAPLETYLYHFEDTTWYYLYAQHQAVGYSMRTRRVVGYLGPNGFSETSDGAGRFPEMLTRSLHHSNTLGLLQFPRSVFLYDTVQRTLTRIWTADASNEQAQASAFLSLMETDDVRQPIVVMTGQRLHVFSGDGQTLFTLPFAPIAHKFMFVQTAVSPAQDRFYFWYSVNGFGGSSWATAQLVSVSSTGKVLKTTELPALDRLHTSQTSPFIGLLVPPAVDAAVFGLALRDQWFGTQMEKDETNLGRDGGLRGLYVLSMLTGLISAVLAWRISLRLGDGRRGQITWTLGVFWLGIYGVLLLLALRAWPARVPCPNCRRLRVVDREECEHCGAAFARPPRDGTEIFDGERERAGAGR